MPRLLIGADLCPIESNLPLFRAGDARGLFNDLLEEFEAADLVVANLECPLIERPSPILKTGPVFGAEVSAINGIKAGGVDLLCLANNHIKDHGAAGIRSTLKACRAQQLETVGVGENLEEASKIWVREIDGMRVGFIALAEHEYSIAREDEPGANPLDLIQFVRSMAAVRGQIDYLVVLFHGGDEFVVPSPRVQETCRFLIEMGASCVVVQHPHVLGGIEHHRGGHIVYGQGALVMDEALYRDRASFHEGILVRLQVEAPGQASLDYVPFRQSDPRPGARRLRGDDEQALRKRLEARSQRILDPVFVKHEWREFALGKRHSYFSSLLGHNGPLMKLNRSGMLERLLYGKRLAKGVRNAVCCETHREALETIFDDLLRSLPEA